MPILIEEHRSHPGWCPFCCKVHYGALPAAVQSGGMAGPRLTTRIAYLKGACHASYATVRKFLRDVVQITISRGQLSKIIGKVSAALDGPYRELLDDLPLRAILNVDETGHKRNGERWWTWCFRASLYTLFKIDPTRSGDVLVKVLGEEFEGVIGCDYMTVSQVCRQFNVAAFARMRASYPRILANAATLNWRGTCEMVIYYGAYRRYQREFGVLLQFCLAHLIRDVKFLLTLPGPRVRAYGERLREALRGLFAVIHRREGLSEKAFAAQLEAARQAVLRAGTQDVPESKHCRNLARRLEKHGESYFRFITTPGVGPTNNLAEQAIRFVVIDRLITQGTRSDAGNRWCERIWTVIATCAQQGQPFQGAKMAGFAAFSVV